MTKIEIESKIEKLQKAINSKATDKRFIPKLKAEKEKFEGELAKLSSDKTKISRPATAKKSSEKVAKAKSLLSKYKYLSNRLVDSVVVNNKGKKTTIDSKDVLDGVYVKKGVQYAKGGEVKVVLDEGNGKVINKLYNEWDNVKTQAEYDKWVKKVQNTKFGTYGTITFAEVLKNFDFDNAPISSFKLKTFKKELESALNKFADGGYMAKGGFVAVSEKDGYWYIMSRPTTKENAEQMIKSGMIPSGELGKVVTLEQAKSHKKVIGEEYLADGGATNISRDRMFKSQQKWEQDYQRKSRPRNPHYKKFEDGGGLDLLADTSGAGLQNVGGSSFSNVDLTPHMDLTNPVFANGGQIKNQYEGRTPENVWENWTISQRVHFLKDHYLTNLEKSLNKNEYESAIYSLSEMSLLNWSKLPTSIHMAVERHIFMGQYAKGGALKMKKEKSFYQELPIYKGYKWSGFWDGYHHFVKSEGKGYYEIKVTDKDIENGNYKDMIDYGYSYAKGGALEDKIKHINETYDGVTASKTYSDNRIQVVSPYFNTLNEIKRKEFGGSGLMERYGNTSSYVLYSNKTYEQGGETESYYSKLVEEHSKGGYEKFGISFDSFLDSKMESAIAKKDMKTYHKLIDVKEKYENDFYAKGGETSKDNRFTYMMLSRLSQDNDYYLGYGNRSERVLWAGNVDAQIEEMKKLWNQLPENEKPEWLSMEDILEYERQMKNDKMAHGGKIKVGDKVRSTTFKGIEGEVLSKQKDYYFVREYNALPNGDFQHHVLRIDEVQKMAHGGSVPENFGKGKNINVFGYETKFFINCQKAVEEFENSMQHANTEEEKESLSKLAEHIDKIFEIEHEVVHGIASSQTSFDEAIKETITASYWNYRSGMAIDLFSFVPQHLKQIAIRLNNTKFEDGGVLNLLADTSGISLQNVGGTSFSNVDLTSHMDLTNPMFANGGGTFNGQEFRGILGEGVTNLWRGYNGIELAINYMKINGQGGMVSAFNNQYKVNELKSIIEKLDDASENKYDDGGELGNPKTKGKESNDWDKELMEYAGSNYSKLSEREKEEIISDMQSDFDRYGSFANGGQTKEKYKIFEGYDIYKNKPIYSVHGVDNDYFGEWHTSKEDVEKELKDLNNKHYANGGSIPNNYRGRTTEDIWNSLTENQRVHFMFDHFDELGIKESEIVGIANQHFKDLNEDVQDAFKRHTMMGQYADGGGVDNNGEGYVIYYSVFRNGKLIPIIIEYYENLSDAEKSLEERKAKKEKGLKIKELNKMPIISEPMIITTDYKGNKIDKLGKREIDSKKVNDYLHSIEKVNEFFKGKDSFFKKNYYWVKPKNYVWDNWQLTKMAHGGEINYKKIKRKGEDEKYGFKYIVREEGDSYVIVEDEKIEQWEKSSPMDRKMYYEDLLPKEEVDNEFEYFADGGSINKYYIRWDSINSRGGVNRNNKELSELPNNIVVNQSNYVFIKKDTINGKDYVPVRIIGGFKGVQLSEQEIKDKKIKRIETMEFAKGGTTNEDEIKSIEDYELKTPKGKSIRKATKVIFTDGSEIKFTEKMTKAEAIKNALYQKNKMAKGGIVVTSIKDIPNFKEKLDEGKITYRGLGMGKLYNDFYEKAGESGTRIKVDGKEYFITDTEFDSFSRGSDGKMRIKFDAPQRKGYAKGGTTDEDGYGSKRELNQDYKRLITNKERNEFETSENTYVGKTVTIKLPNMADSFRMKVKNEYATMVSGGGKNGGVYDKKYIISKGEGGTTTFNDKVKSISQSLLKRKKVSPSVQKDYGKTYDKKEAVDSAKRIAGAMRKKEMAKKKS